MILILSQQNNEPATDIVIEWLIRRKANFVRVNGEDLTNNEFNFVADYAPKNSSDVVLNINGDPIDLNEINVVWYRRWHNFEYLNALNVQDSNCREARSHSIREINAFSNFLFSLIPQATWLSSPTTSNNNKLTTVFKANKLGLKTPKSIITNSKEELLIFFKKCNGKIISKPITNSYYYEKDEYLYSHYTEEINEDFINGLESRFILSNFQETISKKYDLRIFFIEKEFYAVAILPPLNTSNVDIKLDHLGGTLRRVPYQLPTSIQIQLQELMQSIDLNTGSIDMIKGTDDIYYFIEVNPIGIFSDISYYCNLQLEKKSCRLLNKKR